MCDETCTTTLVNTCINAYREQSIKIHLVEPCEKAADFTERPLSTKL